MKVYGTKKLLLVLLGGVVFLFALFQFAISKSISLSDENQALRSELELVTSARERIPEMENELEYLNQMLGSDSIAEDKVQTELLNELHEYCKTLDLNMHQVSEVHRAEQNEFLVLTNVIRLDGSYLDLIALINAYESDDKVSRISSVLFESKKNPRTKKLKLYATIYFQNVIKV